MVKVMKSFVKWLNLEQSIPDAQKFFICEIILFCVIGAVAKCSAEAALQDLNEEDLRRHLPKEKLEMRTLPVPTSPAPKKEKPQPKPKKKYRRIVPINPKVICRLINVESTNDDNALGDKKNGVYRAYGCLQLWQCYVDEVNRLHGTNYTHQDAFDRNKAIEMAELLIGRRAWHYKQKGYEVNEELLVRLHRMPYSPFSSSNDKYWEHYKQKNGLL